MNRRSEIAEAMGRHHPGGADAEDLTRMLLTEQEEERRRLAADLHDEIGQCLSAVQFAIAGLCQGMGDRLTDAERETFACLTRRVSMTIEEVRRICMGLRPPMLDDMGIISTLDWFCDELRQLSTRLEVIERIRATEDAIPLPVKVAIFRIVQEACGNACKHSGARRLQVLLDADAEGIRLEVADDGVGFMPESVHRCIGGRGLGSMRERAAMTGGRLEIQSRMAEGTRVLATWTAQSLEELVPRSVAA